MWEAFLTFRSSRYFCHKAQEGKNLFFKSFFRWISNIFIFLFYNNILFFNSFFSWTRYIFFCSIAIFLPQSTRRYRLIYSSRVSLHEYIHSLFCCKVFTISTYIAITVFNIFCSRTLTLFSLYWSMWNQMKFEPICIMNRPCLVYTYSTVQKTVFNEYFCWSKK